MTLRHYNMAHCGILLQFHCFVIILVCYNCLPDDIAMES